MKLTLLLLSMSIFLILFDKEADESVLAFGIVFLIATVYQLKLKIKKIKQNEKINRQGRYFVREY